MSSRLTVPVSKLVSRSFSSTPAAARPSQLLNKASKAAAATGAGRKARKPVTEETSADHRAHSTTSSSSPHRPVPPSQSKPRTIPFMQTFHHSAPKPAAPSFVTIDRAIFPDLAAQDAQYDPYAHIRVPLLPDNTSPPAGLRAAEAVDAPLPQPEIVVVAANPEQVLPSALTEVEGMGVDGVELGFAHLLGREVEESFEMGKGMIRMWRGMVDDVLNSGSSSSGDAENGGSAAAA
ncbi:uncharacterized protein B0T15DRAFT_92325 [Chaetomium strumarium]|uniref:Uncharacterized protein n=1 Tax=Chaetomium strumarium TaxID=1170767 RepID=A0AAJ0GXI0_9PEZI|nr:hypothetical protein B0T15DRAFT_92325 [Chaetomium strumarium]